MSAGDYFPLTFSDPLRPSGASSRHYQPISAGLYDADASDHPALKVPTDALRCERLRTLLRLHSDSSTLTNLDLSCNQLGNAGAHELSTILQPSTPLRTLDLSVNRITPAGVRPVVTLCAKLSSLSHLNVSGNALCDSGAVTLAVGLMSVRSLRSVNVSGCEVADVGGSALVKAAGAHSQLRSLALDHNGSISDGAMREYLRVSQEGGVPLVVTVEGTAVSERVKRAVLAVSGRNARHLQLSG